MNKLEIWNELTKKQKQTSFPNSKIIRNFLLVPDVKNELKILRCAYLINSKIKLCQRSYFKLEEQRNNYHVPKLVNNQILQFGMSPTKKQKSGVPFQIPQSNRVSQSLILRCRILSRTFQNRLSET
jgi:hypothetical protein